MKPTHKGFNNYSLELDKNQRVILKQFVNQMLQSIPSDANYYPVEKAFSGIYEKLKLENDSTKLTKDEFFKLKEALKRNITHLEKEITKVWFFKRWIMKPMLKQYISIFNSNFKE